MVNKFNEFAEKWDTEKRIDRAKIIADKIISSINCDENSTAMEFGCGTGLVSFNLHDKFKSIHLIDSSQGMIDILNSKIDKYKINNMTTKKIDLTADNSLDKKFDVIYSSMVLHHIQNTSKILNKFNDLLKNNGYLCIVDLDEEDGSFHKEFADYDGHNGFNQEVLKKDLFSSGFSKIDSETFYYDQKEVEGQSVNYSLFLIKAKKYI